MDKANLQRRIVEMDEAIKLVSASNSASRIVFLYPILLYLQITTFMGHWKLV
jgi:hypothetical protein